MDVLYWTLIIVSLGFMIWWPTHYIKTTYGPPQEDECPRCGRMVIAIELHIKRCTGQPSRRWGGESRIFKSFKSGERTDVIGDKRDDELEEL